VASNGHIWEDVEALNVSRQWIFGLVGIVAIAALIVRPGLPLTVTHETRHVYDLIDSLDSGSVVMISFDHEASSLPEVGPLGSAIVTQCFRKSIRIVGLALFSEGTAAGYEILNRRATALGKTYGTDWIYLGFRPQYTAAILGMGENIGDVFAQDYEGHALSETDLGRRVRNYSDVALVISIADGSMPTYWVEYAEARYHVKIVAALTAVMVTSYLPYLESNQLAGIVAGLRGAAEYEQLLHHPGAGSRGMDAQSAVHALIAVLIVFGNVQAWRARRKRRMEDEPG
jgi:hypothetical protein